MTPERIAQIREMAQSEHRTHEWADRTIEELLTEIERAEAVYEPAQLAVRHLRTAAYRLRDAGDSEGDELLATADVLADEIAARLASA